MASKIKNIGVMMVGEKISTGWSFALQITAEIGSVKVKLHDDPIYIETATFAQAAKSIDMIVERYRSLAESFTDRVVSDEINKWRLNTKKDRDETIN